MKNKIDKSIVSEAIISKIRKDRNPTEIKSSHLDEYKSPEKIWLNKVAESFLPDIEAVYEKERIVYEIELNEKITVNKWIAFSKYVQKNKGSLYLVVPKQLKDFVKNVLEDNVVNAGIITFDTQSD